MNENEKEKEQPPRVVIAIQTSCWIDERGLHFRRDIRFLKRQSQGFNFLREDAYMVGAEDTLKAITNFATTPDGVYEVRPDGNDPEISAYKLVPVKKP